MKKILLISDTHGDRTKFKEIIAKENPDITIHAGDFCIDYDEITNYCDYVVAGNNDYEGKEVLDFEIENLKFRLMHGHQFMKSLFSQSKRNYELYEYAKENKIDILVTGHTHIETMFYHNDVLVINPGSLQLPRNTSMRKSYAVIYIDNKKIIDLDFEKVFKYI